MYIFCNYIYDLIVSGIRMGDTIMKKLSRIVLCLALSFCSFSLFAQEKIVLKIGTIAPANSPWDVELKKLAAEWSKITNGTVSIQFQNITTLGGEKAAIQKMRSARPGQRAPLDGAVLSSIGLHESAPSAKVFTLSCPFLIRTQEELEEVIKNFGSSIEAEYKKAGLELLAWTNAGWIRFFTKDSYSDLAGLKRLKIACSGFDSPVLSNALKIAGFTIEDMKSEKVSQSLKSASGVNGIFSVPMLIYLDGNYKNINYALATRLCPVMAGLVLSSNSWSKIPSKYHAEMKAALQRTVARLNSELEVFDVQYTDLMKSKGVKQIELTQAQTEQWNQILTADMRRASNAYPDMFNLKLYDDIQKLLEKMR